VGWWGGYKEGHEQTGWFPGSFVRPTGKIGDDADEDSSFDDSDIKRSSPSASPRQKCPLQTSDNRVVASPQAHGLRRLTIQGNQSQESTDMARVIEENKRLEKELCDERRRVEETLEAAALANRERGCEHAEEIKQLEACIVQMRQEQEQTRVAREMEHSAFLQLQQEKEQEAQEFERQRQEWGRQKQEWSKERQMHEQEGRRSHEDLWRREVRWHRLEARNAELGMREERMRQV